MSLSSPRYSSTSSTSPAASSTSPATPSSSSSSYDYVTYLENALIKYINYINQYNNNPKIIDEIIKNSLESFPDISSPIPLDRLPNYNIGRYNGINSFVSATIKSTENNLLLRLYLLKLLYFKFKIPTKNSPSTERESRIRDYTNTPSKNKICINDFWLLYEIYENYSTKPNKTLNEEMFIVFYKKIFPPKSSQNS